MFIFNILGAVMLAVCFGITYCVQLIVGEGAEGPETVCMGALAILLDITYRVVQPGGHWISPFRGGNLFFIPVWGFGAIWCLVGTVKCFTHPIPIGMFGLGVIGLIVVISLAVTALLLLLASGRADFWSFGGESQSHSMDENGDERPRGDRRGLRCAACKLPCKAIDVKNGDCPWCGEKVEK